MSKLFKEILAIEAQAISSARDIISDNDVDQAVKLLLEAKGKVIVCGVGKSGNVGIKIAATLNSTGTTAVFLHAADALHGDLGVVERGDVMIAISNSGESDEIKAILPVLSSRQIPIVSIVGGKESTLAKASAVVLNAEIKKEACPLNLAPTTSTILAMAVGDALAIELMNAKGITSEVFALNHPAGRLGKRLTLKVEDVMHKSSDLPCVSDSVSFKQLLEVMTEKAMGAVLLTNAENDRLKGILTDGDLRRLLQSEKSIELEKPVPANYFTLDPKTISSDQLAFDALKLMEAGKRQIALLPVVDQGVLVGLIRVHDLVRVGL